MSDFEMDCEDCPNCDSWPAVNICMAAESVDDNYSSLNGCPADFGPWGAWRSILGQLERRQGEFKELCIRRQPVVSEDLYVNHRHHEWLKAAGWPL